MYLLITWLLINALHPLALTFYFNGTDEFISWNEITSFYPLIFFYSLAFSLVSLLLSYGVIYLIRIVEISKELKFLIWLMAACLLVVVNYLMAFGVLGGNIRLEQLEIAIPGIIVTALVILLRYNYFIKMLDRSKPIKQEIDEN